MARWSMRHALCIWDFLLALPRWAACLVGGGNQQVLWPDCCCTRWPGQPTIIDPVTHAANVRRLYASILISNGFTRWPCTRQNAQMLSTVCRKYRLDPKSKKDVQQQNATEGTGHLVLGILPLRRSSIYPPVAVHVSYNDCRRSKTKPSTANKLYICQQTDHLSLSTTIFCRCQQTSSVAVNKLFNCRRSLNQSNSNKQPLQKRRWRGQKMFQRKL